MEQFTDTTDHYNSAFLQAGNIYESVSTSFGSAAPTISSSFARFPAIAGFPNQGMFVPGLSGVRKNLRSNQSTLIVFFTLGLGGLPGSGSNLVLPFFDNGTVQCFVAVSSAGQIQIIRQVQTFGQTLLASSAVGVIGPAVGTKPNHGLELVITFSATSGSVELWMDGAVVIPLTGGLNTIVTANAYANQVGIGLAGSGLSQGQNIYCDYLRVWDTTGSSQNAPVGFDCRKVTKLATGAGFYTQWTANGAASNYQCINEASPDGDTTYVSSSGNNYDSYAMGTSGLAGVPSQVVVKSYARKDDGATRTLQIGVRSGTSDGLGAGVTLGSTYTWIETCIPNDPATGSPPTGAAADAFQFLKYEAA